MPHLTDKIWSNIDNEDPLKCWVWTGHKNPQGYARFAVSVDGKSTFNVGRWMYENLRAEIPWEWLHLDHLCSNPPCVNPWHLEPVPSHLNMARSSARGKARNMYTHPSEVPTDRSHPDPEAAYRVLVRLLLARIVAGEYQLGEEIRQPLAQEFPRSVTGVGWKTAKAWLVAYGVAEEHAGRIYVLGREPIDIPYSPPPVVMDETPLYTEPWGQWSQDPGVVVAWPDRDPIWCSTSEYLEGVT